MSAFVSEFLQSVASLGSLTGLMAVVNIIFIDIVMSGDNAILIGMATRKLQGKDRKKAIVFGIALATVFRIIFASFTAYLMGIVGLKLAGGFLLLYVVWKFYKELRTDENGDHTEMPTSNGLLAAVWTIVVADFSMSLDNVLAVSGAAHGNFAGLAIGLVVSIGLMAFASALIAKALGRYPQIQWLGLGVILFVAIEMILQGSHEIEDEIFHANVLPFVAFVIGAGFLILQQKFLKPVEREKIREWISQRFAAVLVATFVLLLASAHFWDVLALYLRAHPALLWSVTLALFLAILEVLSTTKKSKFKP